MADPATLVIGGGSWGTALANLLAGKGVSTTIWAREDAVVEGINTQRENPVFHGGGLGGRVQRIDWDGNVVWEYVYSDEQNCQHHDIAPLPNGKPNRRKVGYLSRPASPCFCKYAISVQTCESSADSLAKSVNSSTTRRH